VSRFPVVTFLSDFGLDDVFVGVCHAVLAGAAPHARSVLRRFVRHLRQARRDAGMQ
jgi:hypothetical protein